MLGVRPPSVKLDLLLEVLVAVVGVVGVVGVGLTHGMFLENKLIKKIGGTGSKYIERGSKKDQRGK